MLSQNKLIYVEKNSKSKFEFEGYLLGGKNSDFGEFPPLSVKSKFSKLIDNSRVIPQMKALSELSSGNFSLNFLEHFGPSYSSPKVQNSGL